MISRRTFVVPECYRDLSLFKLFERTGTNIRTTLLIDRSKCHPERRSNKLPSYAVITEIAAVVSDGINDTNCKTRVKCKRTYSLIICFVRIIYIRGFSPVVLRENDGEKLIVFANEIASSRTVVYALIILLWRSTIISSMVSRTEIVRAG